MKLVNSKNNSSKFFARFRRTRQSVYHYLLMRLLIMPFVVAACAIIAKVLTASIANWSFNTYIFIGLGVFSLFILLEVLEEFSSLGLNNAPR